MVFISSILLSSYFDFPFQTFIYMYACALYMNAITCFKVLFNFITLLCAIELSEMIQEKDFYTVKIRPAKS